MFILLFLFYFELKLQVFFFIFMTKVVSKRDISLLQWYYRDNFSFIFKSHGNTIRIKKFRMTLGYTTKRSFSLKIRIFYSKNSVDRRGLGIVAEIMNGVIVENKVGQFSSNKSILYCQKYAHLFNQLPTDCLTQFACMCVHAKGLNTLP